jgi:hypothetical protein
VVRNSNFPHGHWGEEERSDNPLHRGNPFKIQIKVFGDRFNVSNVTYKKWFSLKMIGIRMFH